MRVRQEHRPLLPNTQEAVQAVGDQEHLTLSRTPSVVNCH